jgi:glyoxylase-like metal-dependent hydrolase (beta-lactamase superfamily II)/rhodanese-related sulfurtransferase
MVIEISELNGTNCKTYLLVAGEEAALVDPVRERFADYRRLLGERRLTLSQILETHMHADHLMLNREIKDHLQARVIMHRESPSPLVDQHVEDGEVLRLAGEPITVMHTPGHTPDSVCYYLPQAVVPATGRDAPSPALLSGDTLLIGGSGRTDFPGGDAGQQYDAVTGRLFRLPDETVVLPAHDYRGNTFSTIGTERRENPRFLGRSRDGYIALMGSLGLPFPEKIQQALQVNQSGFEASEVVFPLVADIAAVPQMAPADLKAQLDERVPLVVLDVREPEEFVGELGHIGGSLLVPMDALERRLPKLAGYVDREVVVVCRAGARSASAAAMLRRAGFARVFNLQGGMLAWNRAGLPVEH